MRIKNWIYAVGIGGLLITFLVGVPAFAQKKSGKRAPRVIKIDAIKVEGQIQKPEAFFFLQRQELNFEGLEPKTSFIPKIIKSVDKAPF